MQVAQLPLNICWGDRWWQVCQPELMSGCQVAAAPRRWQGRAPKLWCRVAGTGVTADVGWGDVVLVQGAGGLATWWGGDPTRGVRGVVYGSRDRWRGWGQ